MGKVGQVVTRYPVSEWANRRGTTSNDPIPTRNTPVTLLFLITNRRYVTVRSRLSSVGEMAAKFRNEATQHTRNRSDEGSSALRWSSEGTKRFPRDTLFDRIFFNHAPRSAERDRGERDTNDLYGQDCVSLQPQEILGTSQRCALHRYKEATV